MTLDFVDDDESLHGASAEQIRTELACRLQPPTQPSPYAGANLTSTNRNFNPCYLAPEDPKEPSREARDHRLCESADLMINRDAMESVIHPPAKGEPYVIAVDVEGAESEQYAAEIGEDERTARELVQCEYEGTMRVHCEVFLTESYRRSVKDDMLVMGEIYAWPGEV